MRYRGYYYDTETGSYYLKSSYYEPEMGRFINSYDPYIVVLEKSFGKNAFSYCNNNPIMASDPSGYSSYSYNSRTKSYSGIVGIRIGITFSVSLPLITGFAGVEAIWYFPKHNFNNGKTPFIYLFAGGSYGISLDVKKLLSVSSFSSNYPKKILGASSLGVSFSVSINLFVVHAKSFKNQESYEGPFIFDSYTAFSVTYTHAYDKDKNIKTDGVGGTISFGLKSGSFNIGAVSFGASGGASAYKLMHGTTGKQLYDYVFGSISY